MREKFGIWACVWFVLVVSCLGRFVVEKNSLKVTSPDSMKDVYECAIGNFGVPDYGGSMAGSVFYPKSNEKACKNFQDFDIALKTKPGGLPIFLLADRGECFFTLKAWNAQNAGAAAILVADDRVEPLITMDTPEEEDARADYLQNITIPSALISKDLGDKIKKELSKGEMVNINLDWREALPHPDERVEYEFWTNSNDECGPKCVSQLDFVKSFKGAAQILEQKGASTMGGIVHRILSRISAEDMMGGCCGAKSTTSLLLALGNDVLSMIFTFLDLVHLIRCSAVCISWSTVIRKLKLLQIQYHKQQQAESGSVSHVSNLSETSINRQMEQLAMDRQRLSLQEGPVDVFKWKAHSVGFSKCRMKMGLILIGVGDKVMRLWSAESCKALDEYRLPDKAPLIDFDFDEGKVVGLVGTRVCIWRRVGTRDVFSSREGLFTRGLCMRYVDPHAVIGCEDGKEICKTQSSWVIFNDQLREELRSSISVALCNAYRNFIARLQSVPNISNNADRYIRYRVEDIKARINELFQGSGGGRR